MFFFIDISYLNNVFPNTTCVNIIDKYINKKQNTARNTLDAMYGFNNNDEKRDISIIVIQIKFEYEYFQRYSNMILRCSLGTSESSGMLVNLICIYFRANAGVHRGGQPRRRNTLPKTCTAGRIRCNDLLGRKSFECTCQTCEYYK